VDPLSESCCVVERLLDVAFHLLEESLRGYWIRVDHWTGELQLDRERNEVLLHAVVEITLDRATVGIAGKNEPRQGRAQLVDICAELLELVELRFFLLGLQGLDLQFGLSRLSVSAPQRVK
jgi:hypothetical protein